MRKIYTYFGLLIFGVLLTQCKPEENRTDISGTSTKALDFTHVQTTGYDNQLVINFKNTDAVPFYEVCRYDNKVKLMIGNLRTDTFTLPFQGDYLIRVYGYFKSGIVVDSFKATASQADPVFFNNPLWTLMSNDAAGHAWNMAMKYVGPESDYHSNWYTDVSKTNLDTIYFDLNFGFTYKMSMGGVVSTSTWSLSNDGFTYYPNILSFGSTIDVGDNDNGQMSSSNQNKFRIVRCTADSLILAQGADFTPAGWSSGNDWAWYWVFTTAPSLKK